MMKIAVVGIGGIGGYYGGLLARFYGGQKNHEVVFIARGAHLKKIQDRGLRLLTAGETLTAIPGTATDSPADCGRFDVILFCVKTYDLEESARMVSSNVDRQTTVISLLNGVDNAQRLKSVLPKAQVLNGCVYLSAYIVEPGTVQHASGSCKLFFGAEADAVKNHADLQKMLTDAGVDAAYSEDIQTIVWEKYLFISPLASATSYMEKTLGGILADRDGKKLLNGLMGEVESVARHQQVSLPEDICRITMGKVSSFPPDTKTSMQLDFERGKKTELETFTGYVLKYAQRHGIPAPLHQNVYEALREKMPATV